MPFPGNSQFFKGSNKVQRCPYISAQTKTVYNLLLCFNPCYPSIDTLARLCKMDKKTVRRSLNELKSRKLIDWIKGSNLSGKNNLYSFFDPMLAYYGPLNPNSSTILTPNISTKRTPLIRIKNNTKKKNTIQSLDSLKEVLKTKPKDIVFENNRVNLIYPKIDHQIIRAQYTPDELKEMDELLQEIS